MTFDSATLFLAALAMLMLGMNIGWLRWKGAGGLGDQPRRHAARALGSVVLTIAIFSAVLLGLSLWSGVEGHEGKLTASASAFFLIQICWSAPLIIAIRASRDLCARGVSRVALFIPGGAMVTQALLVHVMAGVPGIDSLFGSLLALMPGSVLLLFDVELGGALLMPLGAWQKMIPASLAPLGALAFAILSFRRLSLGASRAVQ